jgi:hypothetical protein
MYEDWNDWIAVVANLLAGDSFKKIRQHWSHVRWAYKQGQSPEMAVEWLSNQG